MDTAEMKKAHALLAEWKYQYSPVDKAYAGQTLYINISENRFASKPVTEQMKDLFVGGRGFDLWLLWNGTTTDTRWDSPENEICISSGPLGGTSSYPGSGKSIATTISPLTGSVVDSNVGGHFGPMLKFSGFDAIEIQGKASEEIIIFIDGTKHTITIETAPLEPIDTHIIGEILTEMYGCRISRMSSVTSRGKHSNRSTNRPKCRFPSCTTLRPFTKLSVLNPGANSRSRCAWEPPVTSRVPDGCSMPLKGSSG